MKNKKADHVHSILVTILVFVLILLFTGKPDLWDVLLTKLSQ